MLIAKKKLSNTFNKHSLQKWNHLECYHPEKTIIIMKVTIFTHPSLYRFPLSTFFSGLAVGRAGS